VIRYAILLVLLVGCGEARNPALREVPMAELAAEIAVRFAAARVNTPTPAPEPPPTTRCNKCTDGKVRTGDGLDWTQCECGDACECESKAPADPPLVPVKPSQSSGRIECRNGTCYWVDDSTGQRYKVVR
jgi:hypothetical protein